jgi:hypothetical protein
MRAVRLRAGTVYIATNTFKLGMSVGSSTGTESLSPLQRQDWLYGSSSLPPDWYRELCPRGVKRPKLKLITYFHLVPGLSMHAAKSPSAIRHPAAALNFAHRKLYPNLYKLSMALQSLFWALASSSIS